MKGQGDRPIRRIVSTLVLTASVGCAPTLDVFGVFFPGWLVSTIIGVVTSYGIVVWLSRYPGTRVLADSGLFFLSLLVGVALAARWVLFSDF